MPHFKDDQNRVYFLDEGVAAKDWLPADVVPISDADAAALCQPAPSVPSAVPALRGLKAIDHFGFASAYDAWANDPARTFLERAFINKAQTWERDDATLTAAALALGLTEAQLDAMFTWAAS